MDRRIPAASVPLIQERISCSFEEHHCLSFGEPLVAPARRDGIGEDIFNAWFPQDLEFTRRTVRTVYTPAFTHNLFPRNPRTVWKFLTPAQARTHGTRRTTPTAGPLILARPVNGCPMD